MKTTETLCYFNNVPQKRHVDEPEVQITPILELCEYDGECDDKCFIELSQKLSHAIAEKLSVVTNDMPYEGTKYERVLFSEGQRMDRDDWIMRILFFKVRSRGVLMLSHYSNKELKENATSFLMKMAESVEVVAEWNAKEDSLEYNPSGDVSFHEAPRRKESENHSFNFSQMFSSRSVE